MGGPGSGRRKTARTPQVPPKARRRATETPLEQNEEAKPEAMFGLAEWYPAYDRSCGCIVEDGVFCSDIHVVGAVEMFIAPRIKNRVVKEVFHKWVGIARGMLAP